MKTSNRVLALMLAAVMAFGLCTALTGCRRRRPVEKSIVDHAYRVTTLEKPEGMRYASQFFASGGRVYMSYIFRDEETGERHTRVFSIGTDGSDLREDELPVLQEETPPNDTTSISTQQLIPAPDGSFWKIVYISSFNEETFEFTEDYYLRHQQPDGTVLLSVNGADFWGPPPEDESQRVYHYMEMLTAVGDGVLFIDNQVLYSVSSEGKLLWKTDLTEMGEGWVQQILAVDGAPVLMYTDYSSSVQKTSLIPVNPEDGKIGEPHELDAAIFRNVWNYFYGDGYTFYYSDDEALYGYDMATGTSELLMNFVNSDISSNAVNRLIILSPDRFISNGYDNMSGDYELLLMERIPDEEQIPKYILTVGTMNHYTVQEDVIRFNRQNDEYRMTIRTYSPDDYYVAGEERDYNTMQEMALTALNNDIIRGNAPDVLAVDASMQMEIYTSKGLFVDMFTLLDADERFTRDDFLTNVLDAFSVNGKLYELSPSFNVQTLLGKRSMLGERSGWTMREFIEWSKNIPEESVVFYDMTRDTLLEMFCTYAYEEFVDPDTGECFFDSEDFKLVLEYANTLSNESIWDKQNGEYDEEFNQNYQNRFRDNKAMLERFYLSYFGSIAEAMNYTFYTEEELVPIGLPSSDRTGSVIYTNTTYAVSAQSQLTDGAWQFVSYFLTEEYQDTIDYEFPLRRSSLAKMADEDVAQAEEQKKRYEERQQQNGMIGGDIYYGDMVVMPAPIAPMQQQTRVFLDRAMADRIIEYLGTLNHVYRTNPKVLNIIKEDAAAYFAGTKTIEETVKLIQNRVSTLVAESR